MDRRINSPQDNSNLLITPSDTKTAKFPKEGGIIVGQDASDANNVKIHRSGATEIQFVPGNDATPEGSRSGTNATLYGGVPAGVVLPYVGSSAPDGWLLCNGSMISKTTYSALFVVIGIAFGDGGATFKLPDLRDTFPKGVASAGEAVGCCGGCNSNCHSHGMDSQLGCICHTHSIDSCSPGTDSQLSSSTSVSVGGTLPSHCHRIAYWDNSLGHLCWFNSSGSCYFYIGYPFTFQSGSSFSGGVATTPNADTYSATDGGGGSITSTGSLNLAHSHTVASHTHAAGYSTDQNLSHSHTTCTQSITENRHLIRHLTTL